MEKELNIASSKPLKEEEEEKKTDTWKFSKSKDTIKVKYNVQFENYYKEIGILDPSEWDTFYSKLKEPLDITFRINSVE